MARDGAGCVDQRDILGKEVRDVAELREQEEDPIGDIVSNGYDVLKDITNSISAEMR